MRILPIAFAFLVYIAAAAQAEDMVAGKDGLMCRTDKALADLTAPNGSATASAHQDPFSPLGKEFMADCKDLSGETVHVVTKRKNTSIVTLNGETWYVANINFFTPTAACLKELSAITVTGVVESGYYDPDNGVTNPFHYLRLKLDKPVCYVGDHPDMAASTISLMPMKRGAYSDLMKLVGRRVTVNGTVGSPTTGSQPPDPMMIDDPVVKPTP